MSGQRYQRTKRESQRLVGYECQSCGWVSFPVAKQICKRCGEAPADFAEVNLAKKGIIQSFVIQERLPDEFETPQPIAIVDIPKVDGDGAGPRVFAILTESEMDELEIGMVVDARFREIFTNGDRPIHSFKFSVPRGGK